MGMSRCGGVLSGSPPPNKEKKRKKKNLGKRNFRQFGSSLNPGWRGAELFVGCPRVLCRELQNQEDPDWSSGPIRSQAVRPLWVFFICQVRTRAILMSQGGSEDEIIHGKGPISTQQNGDTFPLLVLSSWKYMGLGLHLSISCLFKASQWRSKVSCEMETFNTKAGTEQCSLGQTNGSPMRFSTGIKEGPRAIRRYPQSLFEKSRKLSWSQASESKSRQEIKEAGPTIKTES